MSRVWFLCASLVLGVSCVPAGFSTFFEGKVCPNGWEALPVARGRLLVTVVDAAVAGVTVNTPLGDREDRSHKHPFTTSIQVPEKDVAAIECCNNEGGHHGDYAVTNQTSESSSGYPFTQLLLCTYSGPGDDDPLAFGTVGYFDPNIPSCPDGWSPMQTANGRILVPGYDSGVVSNTVASLKSGEDRQHSHSYNVSISLGDTSYAGAEGCCNHNTAASTEVFVQGTTNQSSTGLPYVQLLTCVSTRASFETTLPPLARIFNTLACPPDWILVSEVSGRMLVPLPLNGLPGASFGGDSLPPNADTNSSLHAHIVEGQFDLPATGVGLAAGCCGDGYAKAASYLYHGATESASEDLPYTMLPLCERATRAKERKALAPNALMVEA